MPTSIPDISTAIDRLRAGGVVAFPTETVYGLGADALNEHAVQRVYDLKGRPSINPLIVHVRGPDMAARLVREWTDDAAALARMYWPGPLTIVLPRARAGPDALIVPDLVTARGPTIAVRCPDHPVALALLFGLGSPLVGPSANPSGRVSPTTAAHVRESFSEEDVMVLEGGPCRAGIESTVVSLVGHEPRILRPGLIDAGEVAAVIGRPVLEAGALSASRTDPSTPLPAPGMLARHYAPGAPARLIDADDLPRALEGWHGHPARGRPPVIISHTPIATGPARVILLPDDAEDYAFHLYSALREADAMQPPIILIIRPPDTGGAWTAIHDRLRRATTRD